MLDSADFDAFYADARERLLHQTFALTGDLRASQASVRDAFIGAWHHWRKVSRLDDRERWVRPLAWSYAQRRHGARLWHREKADDPELAQTLEALGKLPLTQRKMLLLSTLTQGSMEDLAREAGLPLESAQRELQVATSLFSAQRNVDPAGIRHALEALASPAGETSWPRATIIRRTGTRRRRTHLLVGVVATVGALVGSGIAVGYDGHTKPSLARHTTEPKPSAIVVSAAPEPPAELTRRELLSAAQVARLAPGLRWKVADTTENVEGDGRVLPCQLARFADPRSTGTLVRTYSGASADRPRRGAVPSAAYQATELSRTPKAAELAFDTTLGWYAGCTEDRVQLLSTHRVDGVGDEAVLVVLRSWADPSYTMVAGVARTGRVTTTMLSRLPAVPRDALPVQGSLLAAAVNSLCGSPGAGTCAGPPALATIPSIPTGQAPGMLGPVDLPPVTAVDETWVGTEPRLALVNAAATQCDNSSFGRPVTNALTRTFLFPRADLPDTFGLTETVGSLPADRAAAFVEAVRRRMGSCEDRNLGTQVVRVANSSTGSTDLTVWNLTVEISDQQTITYLMGIVRSGTSIAQVGFTPTREVRMGPGDFTDLMARALERLAQMPPPKGGKGGSGTADGARS